MVFCLCSGKSITSLRQRLIKVFAPKRASCLGVVALAVSSISGAGAVEPAMIDAVTIKTISIVADEWYPMNGTPNSKTPGFMIEIAQQAAAHWDASISYRIMPWNKAVELVGEGHFDCVIGAYKEDAPDFVFPKHHWGVDQIAFYGKQGKDWRFSDYQDLAGQRLGVIEGYSYGEAMDQWLAQHPDQVVRLSKNDALESLVLMLIGNRIDLVLESQAVMMNKLTEQKLKTQIVGLGLLDEMNPLYLACSPQVGRLSRSQTIVRQMDQAFKTMRQSQQLESILSRYGIDPWW